MKPEEVMAQARTAVEAKYEPRIDKATQDPGSSSASATRCSAS